MRTTVVFDPDVAAELQRRRIGLDVTLRDDVNRLIRLGLAYERAGTTEPAGPFSTPTFDTGRPLIPVDDVEAALEQAEGGEHR